ncbi:MAG: hypothetical protein ACOC4D_01525 [Bacteroidota bacterium]
MKIKKYIASSLREGKTHITRELGDDAIILSSRNAVDPKTGENIVEIVAAIDDGPKPEKNELPESHESKINFTPPNTGFSGLPDKIHKEIEHMHSLLRDVANNIRYKYSSSLNEVNRALYKKLIDAEVSEALALKIIAAVSAANATADTTAAFDKARAEIASMIEIFPAIKKADGAKKIIFLGTSGSGKTSTLVKLAVITQLVQKADVLIISADTYKVGGAEQLQTFASIAGISFKSVYSAEDLEKTIHRELERDFIFIDTIGKSYKDEEHISELKEYIRAAKPDANYLTMCANYSRTTQIDMINSFKTLKPDALIFTKTDETSVFGGLLDVLNKTGLPVAYFTKGQKIPDDIDPAKPLALAEMILPVNIHDKES